MPKKRTERDVIYMECEKLIKQGVTEFADNANGYVAEAVRQLKVKYPDVLLATDCKDDKFSDRIIKFL